MFTATKKSPYTSPLPPPSPPPLLLAETPLLLVIFLHPLPTGEGDPRRVHLIGQGKQEIYFRLQSAHADVPSHPILFFFVCVWCATTAKAEIEQKKT